MYPPLRPLPRPIDWSLTFGDFYPPSPEAGSAGSPPTPPTTRLVPLDPSLNPYYYPEPPLQAIGGAAAADRSVEHDTAELYKGDPRWEMARCGDYAYHRRGLLDPPSIPVARRGLPNNDGVATASEEKSKRGGDDADNEGEEEEFLAPEIFVGDNTFLFAKAISPALEWFARGRVLSSPLPPQRRDALSFSAPPNSNGTVHLAAPPAPSAAVGAPFGATRRLGFCQKLLELGTVSVTEDLWVGVLAGQLGAPWAVRRGHRHLGHVTRREAFFGAASAAVGGAAVGESNSAAKGPLATAAVSSGGGNEDPKSSLNVPTPHANTANNNSSSDAGASSDDCLALDPLLPARRAAVGGPAVLIANLSSAQPPFRPPFDAFGQYEGCSGGEEEAGGAKKGACGVGSALLPADPLHVVRRLVGPDAGVGDIGGPPIDYLRRQHPSLTASPLPLSLPSAAAATSPLPNSLGPTVLLEEFAAVCPMSREEAAAHRYGLSAMRRVLDEELWRTAGPLPPASSTAGEIGASRLRRQQQQQEDEEEEEAAAAFIPQCHVAPISTRHLDPRPSAGGSPPRATTSVCPLVVGRPVAHDIQRTRGIPKGMEFAIVDALLMPLPHSSTHEEEKKGGGGNGKWGRGGATNDGGRATDGLSRPLASGDPTATAAVLRRSSAATLHKALHSTDAGAIDRLEALNKLAGLPPCALGPQRQRPFMYQGLTFAENTSVYLPISNSAAGTISNAGSDGSQNSEDVKADAAPLYTPFQLRRVAFEELSVVEQYRRAKAADLFIVEEGAPAAWTFLMGGGDPSSSLGGGTEFSTLGGGSAADAKDSPRPKQPAASASASSGRHSRHRRRQREVTVVLVFAHNYERYLRAEDERLDADSRVVRVPRPAPLEVLVAAEFFLPPPEVTRNVRVIAFVYQQGRLPSFAALRAAYDRPWRAETILVGCECGETRVALYKDLEHLC